MTINSGGEDVVVSSASTGGGISSSVTSTTRLREPSPEPAMSLVALLTSHATSYASQWSHSLSLVILLYLVYSFLIPTWLSEVINDLRRRLTRLVWRYLLSRFMPALATSDPPRDPETNDTEPVRVFVGTWNLERRRPNEATVREWLAPERLCDVYVCACQDEDERDYDFLPAVALVLGDEYVRVAAVSAMVTETLDDEQIEESETPARRRRMRRVQSHSSMNNLRQLCRRQSIAAFVHRDVVHRVFDVRVFPPHNPNDGDTLPEQHVSDDASASVSAVSLHFEETSLCVLNVLHDSALSRQTIGETILASGVHDKSVAGRNHDPLATFDYLFIAGHFGERYHLFEDGAGAASAVPRRSQHARDGLGRSIRDGLDLSSFVEPPPVFEPVTTALSSYDAATVTNHPPHWPDRVLMRARPRCGYRILNYRRAETPSGAGAAVAPPGPVCAEYVIECSSVDHERAQDESAHKVLEATVSNLRVSGLVAASRTAALHPYVGFSSPHLLDSPATQVLANTTEPRWGDSQTPKLLWRAGCEARYLVFELYGRVSRSNDLILGHSVLTLPSLASVRRANNQQIDIGSFELPLVCRGSNEGVLKGSISVRLVAPRTDPKAPSDLAFEQERERKLAQERRARTTLQRKKLSEHNGPSEKEELSDEEEGQEEEEEWNRE